VSQSSLANTPDNFVREEARRSTRIERSVPLIIFGQNRLGEPFVERTVSTSINLHGCRYPSRHDYGVGAWITLQVVGLNVEPKPPAVRARVRSVHTSQSTRELQQVGVELENPGNVWGIVTPPQDWLSYGAPTTSTTQFTTAAARAPEVPSLTAEIDERQLKVEHKMAEVATFPSPSPVVSMPAAPKLAEAPKPQRVVITPDGLINALQGKLQQAAEKAVQAAVANQLDEAVRNALATIDTVRQSSIREVQELFPTRVEPATLSSKEAVAAEIAAHLKTEMEKYRAQVDELAQRLEKQAAELKNELARSQEFLEKMNCEIQPQVHSGLSEAVARATSEFEGAASRAVDRRYERMLENTQAITHEALLRLDARSAEVQALVQSAVNSALASFQRQTEMHANVLLSETKERAASALASLDAESRAACEVRRQALESEVARSTERSTDQFRKGMKAFLYSCLVAAVSAVDEHSKSTLEGLLKDNGKSLQDASGDSGNLDEPQIIPGPDKDPFTH
jgi:sugar-specific transcriptional regulator TrmB